MSPRVREGLLRPAFFWMLGASLTLNTLTAQDIVKVKPGNSSSNAPINYKVPKGDLDELRQFIQLLESLEDKDLPSSDQEEYLKKAPRALIDAGNRAIELAGNTDSATSVWAKGVVLRASSKIVGELSAKEQERLLADTSEYLRTTALGTKESELAFRLATAFEVAGNAKVARQAWGDFASIFASTDIRVGEYGKAADVFRNAAERLKLVGKPLNLEGRSIDGESFALTALRGRVVLVHFTAPASLGQGKLQEAYEQAVEWSREYQRRGLDVVLVSLNRNPNAVRQAAQKHNISWVILDDSEGRLKQRFAVPDPPYNILVDRKGVALYVGRGDGIGPLLVQQFGGAER